MLKRDRQNYILNKLQENSSIKLIEIANELDFSEVTIRRDFEELENKGLLLRVHGGAINVKDKLYTELSHDDKQILNVKEKNIIADEAIKILYGRKDINVYIGPGTTLEMFSSKITNNNINIYTNSLTQFSVLQNKGIDAILLGGKYRKIAKSFVGPITDNFLQSVKFDIGFFSCNAVKDNRAMTSEINGATTLKLAMERSYKKFLLVDNSKFGKEAFYSFATLDQFNSLITNDISDNYYNIFSKYVDIIY